MVRSNLEIIDYPRVIARNWKTALIGTIICGAVAGGVTLFLPDRFEATAQIIAVEPRFQSDEAYSKQPFTLKRFSPLLEDPGLLKDTLDALGLNSPPNKMTVKDLGKLVKAELLEESEIIEFRVSTPSPDLSARIANSLAEGFRRKMRAAVVSAVLDSKGFLQERLTEAREKLRQAEEELAVFQETARLNELRTRLGSLAYLEETYARDLSETEVAISIAPGESPPEAAPSGTGPGSGRSELASLEKKKASLETLRRNNLEALGALQKDLARKEVEASRRERSVAIQEEVARDLAKSYEESILAIYQQVGEVQVISPAVPPDEKAGPSLELNILFGLIAGFFVGSLAVFYREYLRSLDRANAA
jgi:uncharacterized protein involved in exopolysaccharide biosynthesis